MKYSLHSFLYAGIVLLATDVSGLITEAPLNAAAAVRQQTIFNCTSNVQTQQNWIFSANREDLGTSAAQDIVRLCDVQPGFTADYAAERPGGSNYKCSLIIKAAAMQLAGVYTCSDTDRGPSAILTVIDGDPSIAVSNRVGVVAGDRVTMSYAVRYKSSTASSETPTMQPVLTWTDSDGKTIPSSETPGTNSVTSSISVTAQRKDILPYTCRIFYSINGSSKYFATNPPRNVSTPISTATIPVSYDPVIETLRKSDLVPVCPGDTVQITCDATANPPAFYSWIGPDSRNYSGAKIEVEKNGVYTCTASNTINGSENSISKSIEVNVLCWFWLLLLLWFLNPISSAIFLIHYKCSEGKSDYNERYPFLTRMLPCINNSEETLCKKVAWTTLFVVMAIFSGIQFLILTIVTCAGCRSGNGRVFGDGCAQTEGTTQGKYARKSIDETVKQKSAHQTEQIENGKVIEAKRKKRKAGKSTHHDQPISDASEPQSHATNARGTRFQKVCFALSLTYMILGIILFPISVGVISYECDRQCNKR